MARQRWPVPIEMGAARIGHGVRSYEDPAGGAHDLREGHFP